MSTDEYLLGSSAEELERLAFQHRVWAEDTYALWRRARIGVGDTVLDLGSGPGFTSLDLAHLVGPTGTVVAVDSAARFLDHLRHQAQQQGLENLRLQKQDVTALDLSAESLDGAYARWLFCFLREPLGVIQRVARVLKEGGRFAITDYFNYRGFTVAPRDAAFDRVVGAVESHWRDQGGDLEVQGSLPSLLESCGLKVEEITYSARVARPGSPLWEWPRTFFSGFLPALVAAGYLEEAEVAAFDEVWRCRAEEPGSYLCLPPLVHLVAVKE